MLLHNTIYPTMIVKIIFQFEEILQRKTGIQSKKNFGFGMVSTQSQLEVGYQTGHKTAENRLKID